MSSGSSKEQTIGYKYHAAIHMVLCHGPIDYVKKINIDEDATLIEGNYRAGSHTVVKENLFGGEKKQGGVSGVLHIMDGNKDQQRNTVVERLQGNITGPSTVPAYRGVASLFLSGIKSMFRNKDGMYLGMNPYLKTWKTLVQRIYSTSNGDEQWYKEKAAIPSIFDSKSRIMFQISIDTSGSMAGERLSLVKIQLKNLLDFFSLYAEDSQLDISIVEFGGIRDTFIEQYNVDDAKMQVLKDFIDSLSAGGGTDFRAAFFRANGFFQPKTIRKDTEKYMFFITDGVPDNENNADQARSENASMINGTGDWSACPVSITGFNIELNDISQTRKVVNNGVYIIQSADSSGMIDAAQNAFQLAYWDMNPIHIIRECLTNESWGNEIPAYEIDDVSFKKAADVIYSEALGMSIKWTQEGSVHEFIGEVLRHINAVLYEEPKTGLQTIKLIRDDYDIDNLPILDESKITQVSDFQKSSFGELVNQITVTYTDVQTGENGTVSVQDTALVAAQGETNSKSIKYQGFSNIKNAGRAGMRDLKSYATPLISAEITVTRSAGIDYRQGDVFLWNWKKYEVSGVVMRIVAIGLGDARDNKITLTCVEDIFALPQSTVTTVKPEVPSSSQLEYISTAIAFEVPYLELVQRLGEQETNQILLNSPEAGFYGVAAEKPDGGASLNAELYLTSLTSGNFLIDSTVNFCPTFELPAPLDFLDTEVILPEAEAKDFGLINPDEDFPLISQIGDELISIWMIEPNEADETYTIRFYRGILDTVPARHNAGETCFIWDVLGGGSENQYIEGETVIGKLLNQSISASTELEDAEELPVTFNSRANRPYPPAAVKINGEFFPEIIEAPLVMTWIDRNRLLQTGGNYLGWDTEISLAPEQGLTYRVEVEKYSEDGRLIITQNFDLGYVNEFSDLADAYFVGIRLFSVREGVDCYQPFYWKTKVAQEFSEPYNLRAEISDGTIEPVTFGKPFNIRTEVNFDG